MRMSFQLGKMDAVEGGVGGGSDFDWALRNFSGVLQDKLPNIDIHDIPGLGKDDGVGGDGPQTKKTYFAIFMCSLIFGIFWITYITFFNSRVVGSILTRIANSRIFQKLALGSDSSDHSNPGHIEVCYRTVFDDNI